MTEELALYIIQEALLPVNPRYYTLAQALSDCWTLSQPQKDELLELVGSETTLEEAITRLTPPEPTYEEDDDTVFQEVEDDSDEAEDP